MEQITKILLDNQDIKYKEFNSKLIPNIDKEKVIGVRLPIVRNIAKEIKDEDYIDNFLNNLPHQYHEENLLHGKLLTLKYKDIDTLLHKLDIFLPYVDNWAITDTICPKLFRKHPEKVYKKIKIWINSNNEYVIRFGIVSLLQFYLDDNYNREILEVVKSLNSNYFYVNMAIAWFYSFAIIKQYDDTIKYFESKTLPKWIHNKSLQKAIESYRVSDERKKYLKNLKIK